MRILQTVAPGEFGGLEEVVIRLARGLARRGHQVTLASVIAGAPRAHPFLAAAAAPGVDTVPIFLPSRSYLREISTVRQLAAESSTDVLHTHGYRPGVLHPRAVRQLGIPVVTTFHGFTGGGWKNRLFQRLHERVARSIHATIAVSQPIAEHFLDRGFSRSRVHTVPNAWESRGVLEDPEAARKALGVPEGTFHVGWIGRVSPEKGLDILLQGLNRLPDLGHAAVSVIGDGSLRGELEERARGIRNVDIRFHGAIPEAGRLFAGFDLFVLSSRSEGTPMVLFEAMEAGTPIIATTVGGVPDVLSEDAALLVPPENPHALAQAIIAVRQDPHAAAERAARAKAILLERFATDPWLQRHEEIYASVMETRTKGAAR